MHIINANTLIQTSCATQNAVVLYIVELKICTCGIEFVIVIWFQSIVLACNAEVLHIL